VEERTVKVEGQVTTESGRAVPSSVTVRLEREGTLALEQPANSAGQFEFADVPKTFFRMVVTAEGFQPYERGLDLTHGAFMTVVKVVLSPLPKTSLTSASPPSLTDERAPKKARSEYQKGARALEEKKWNEAEAHFANAVKEYDCYARAHTELAIVRSAQRQLPRAEEELKKALACDPGFLDAYSELGQLYYSEKKYVESEGILKEGLRRSPGAWQFYYQLGSAHYRLGKYHDAEVEFERAQSFNTPPPPEIHVKLADVYLRESDYAKAYAEMQAYLRAEPDGRFAGKVRSIMQQMEADGTSHSAQTSTPSPLPPKP
jgi:tetratricopeptide (TPR) repeat protein